ncbi:hypothetical protein H2198_002928 [Neophaeococcomyces mojaviensis]|uniref:Uncharacterized protein n=1 Tax=Neophaeococcomyces mojaviensis TaxID=3383035 RepID=A0ACC3ACY2_9EURO|nr:hypothetical protein H2198_002928 [Knufia sp. JES_112]
MYSREVLYIIELVYWVPASVVSCYVTFKHGFSRQMGWFNLTMLSLFRIIGAVTGLIAISHPSEGVIETSFICASVGLMALIGALSGIMLRVNMNMYENSIITPERAKSLHLPTVAAMILSIVAGSEIGNDRPSDVAQALLFFKISIALVTAVYIVVAFVTVYTARKRCFVLQSEQLLVKIAVVSIPFISVRLIYSWLASWLPMNSLFFMMNQGATATVVRAIMALCPEFIVASMFLWAGVMVDEKSAPTRAAIRAGLKDGAIEVATAKIVEIIAHKHGRV